MSQDSFVFCLYLCILHTVVVEFCFFLVFIFALCGRRCGLRCQKHRGSLTSRLSFFMSYGHHGYWYADALIRVPGDDAARVVKSIEAVLQRGSLFYVLWTPRLLIRRHPHSRAWRRHGSRCHRENSLSARIVNTIMPHHPPPNDSHPLLAPPWWRKAIPPYCGFPIDARRAS